MHAGTGSLLDDVHEAEADYDEPDELFTYDGVPLECASTAGSLGAWDALCSAAEVFGWLGLSTSPARRRQATLTQVTKMH